MNKFWIVLAKFCVRQVKAKNKLVRSDKGYILGELQHLSFSIGYRKEDQ